MMIKEFAFSIKEPLQQCSPVKIGGGRFLKRAPNIAILQASQSAECFMNL